jgi:hypothetical protein
MADLTIDVAPILAQISSDVLIEELRRRLGLAALDGDTQNGGPGMAPAGGREPAMGQIRPDEFFRLSIPEAAKKFLSIMKRPQTPKAIVEGLRAGGVLTNAKNFYGNVYKELMRMDERGELANTPSGWGLAEWYPSKPKGPDAKPKKKARKRAAKPKALKDGTMVGATKARAAAASNERPLTYREFMGEYMRAGKPKTELGHAWAQYKTEHGLAG